MPVRVWGCVSHNKSVRLNVGVLEPTPHVQAHNEAARCPRPLALLSLTTAVPLDEGNKLAPRAEKKVCGEFERSCCNGYYCAASLEPCPDKFLCDLISREQPCKPGVKPCCTGYCPKNDDPKNCPAVCIPNHIEPPPSVY